MRRQRHPGSGRSSSQFVKERWPTINDGRWIMVRGQSSIVSVQSGLENLPVIKLIQLCVPDRCIHQSLLGNQPNKFAVMDRNVVTRRLYANGFNDARDGCLAKVCEVHG